jgi:5-formyltetrahydrofolate cyclo-ligase
MELNRKKLLRQQLIAQRRSLAISTWHNHNIQICEHLANSELIKNAEVILGFISFSQEPDLADLYQRFSQKTWGFPRCVGKNLAWHQAFPSKVESFVPSDKYGILEPLSTLPTIDLTRADVILVPAIAANNQGYRLGYGGGYYDRFLSNQAGFTISVIFSDFVLPIPTDLWDLPTQAICTENVQCVLLIA